MARRRIDPAIRIREILQHVGPLPPEATSPSRHYDRSRADLRNMFRYFVGKIGTEGVRISALNRHLIQLYRMMLVQLVETFERFVKELAAVCVDHLAEFILDRRFDEFRITGGTLISHFQGGSVGRAVCEADTWLDCKDINDRFRKLLADPFEGGGFYVFPTGSQQPVAERFRFGILSTIWQLRHTIVHNVGVITHSDAVKFRLLVREPVAAPRLLEPTRDDLWAIQKFLDETVESINRRVGERLAEVLTTLHAGGHLAFVPQERSDQRGQDTLCMFG